MSIMTDCVQAGDCCSSALNIALAQQRSEHAGLYLSQHRFQGLRCWRWIRASQSSGFKRICFSSKDIRMVLLLKPNAYPLIIVMKPSSPLSEMNTTVHRSITGWIIL